MKLIRDILGLPFLFVGFTFFRLAEIIKGAKLTYRAREVQEKMIGEVTAECSQCYHVGSSYIHLKK